MGLTQCPYCHRQCFSDATSCPTCGRIFQPGRLQSQAAAKEKAFSTNANILFLSLFLTSLAVLVFVELQAYFNSVGFFRP